MELTYTTLELYFFRELINVTQVYSQNIAYIENRKHSYMFVGYCLQPTSGNITT